MITLQQFAAIMGCTQMTAAMWHQPMLKAMDEFGIDTRQRIAGFLANVGHESGNLNRLEENLNYGAQRLLEVWPRRFPGGVADAAHYEHSPEILANYIYRNRYGNGGEASGDGWKYRGRGPIQITFADNYRRCGQALSLPLIEQPELLLEPEPGARSAGWFWMSHGCNEAADACDNAEMCLRINGGSSGLDARSARFDLAMRVMA